MIVDGFFGGAIGGAAAGRRPPSAAPAGKDDGTNGMCKLCKLRVGEGVPNVLG